MTDTVEEQPKNRGGRPRKHSPGGPRYQREAVYLEPATVVAVEEEARLLRLQSKSEAISTILEWLRRQEKRRERQASGQAAAGSGED